VASVVNPVVVNHAVVSPDVDAMVVSPDVDARARGESPSANPSANPNVRNARVGVESLDVVDVKVVK
jgi:hypothetical protein